MTSSPKPFKAGSIVSTVCSYRCSSQARGVATGHRAPGSRRVSIASMSVRNALQTKCAVRV